MDSYCIRAKWIMPDYGPPMEGHYLVVKGGLIRSIQKQPEGVAIDLGDCCVMAPLVNAHCHLDLSDFERPIPYDGDFTHWIAAVIRHRIQSAQKPNAAELQAAARRRAITYMQAAGTGTVYDIVNTLPAESDAAMDFEIIRFAEMISINSQRAADTTKGAARVMAGGRAVGFSPHASYTVERDLLGEIVNRSRVLGYPIAMHVAESREEIDWLHHRAEPFESFLSGHADEHFRERSFGSVAQIIELLGGGYRSLLVHGNYLSAFDIDLLADRSDRIAVVYCPRTHAAFGHDRHPIEKLLEKGIEVFLGTDSLASNPDLSVWAEAQYVYRQFPSIAPETILRMITTGPRQFMLAVQGGLGISIGSRACFAKIELPVDRAIDSTNLAAELLAGNAAPKLVMPPPV